MVMTSCYRRWSGSPRNPADPRPARQRRALIHRWRASMAGGIWTPLQRHWSDEKRRAAEQQSQQAEEAGLFSMT